MHLIVYSPTDLRIRFMTSHVCYEYTAHLSAHFIADLTKRDTFSIALSLEGILRTLCILIHALVHFCISYPTCTLKLFPMLIPLHAHMAQ